MSNPGFSPFGRSQLVRRSPPPTPSPAAQSNPIDPTPTSPKPEEKQLELISTPEIQKWMGTIETILSEVCSIVSEGKMNTDQKLRVTNLCRKVSHGTSQMAVLYQSLKQKAITAHDTMYHLQEQQNVDASLQQLKDVVKTKLQSESTSYANMVKKGVDNYIRSENLSSVAIYPSDKKQSSEATKELVQKIISPEALRLHVRDVRKIKDGGVVIRTNSKDDVIKLKTSEKLISSGLTVEEPPKRRPRVAIIGVPVALTEKEVFECLFEQNLTDDKLPNMTRESFIEAIKLSHKSGKKDRPTCTYVVEVQPSIRKVLVKQGRVFINWTSCPVWDFTIVTRCFNCQQFGHAAKFCRETCPTCHLCGETGHTFKDCSKKSFPPQCATCKRFKRRCDHPTGDANCPARKFAEDNYINTIDYEGA